MRSPLICQWLELPSESWPPDHYTLLGLERGENRLDRIEERVHQRWLTLRQYQLSHPEHATEAMNCIARAFMCLTDAEAKRSYDARLSTQAARAKPVARQPVLTPERALENTPTPTGKRADPTARKDAKSASDAGTRAVSKPPEPRAENRAVPMASPAAEARVDDKPTSKVDKPAQDKSARAEPEPPKPAVLDWAAAPPPQRIAVATGQPETDDDSEEEMEPAAAAAKDEPILMSEPADPVLETARSSPAARRGLGTRSALYERVLATRELLLAWDQAGKYLNNPARRVKRKAEAKELLRALREVRDCLREFPPLIGKAGQPGYLVSALARQAMIVATFRGLSGSQREALARDWHSARTLLWLHRCFLLEELRRSRRRSVFARTWRAITSPFVDHPSLVVFALLVLLINLAAWAYAYWM